MAVARVSAGRTDTVLGERYRWIARRRGKKRAIVAVGRSILVIVWALLSDIRAQFIDHGADYHAIRTNLERRVRHHVREVQALGDTVTLNPGSLTAGTRDSRIRRPQRHHESAAKPGPPSARPLPSGSRQR